ncbi:hypothetical protein pEaSNUABM35_00195 [Erwinia phage pEa_SNUABM_35]|uniref:Uncharacterized protein n=1 Tax=Erwinia phage pEa_SNUABM_35 TaxID=2869557 RepID=A0AAE7XPS4_9CAUD|nr:hypothetical protein MPK65_gp195 [Erwinia phage pEa_SNUABM_35]QZE60112.1 hypothetical protein pEaSNUABM35_00195 [Erwinia phage pEa_SNUABM_35]QZE60448.1 hypothetical protein pEaSNUABM36_00195 [Erwinia phage pEa_SNUABM_36]
MQYIHSFFGLAGSSAQNPNVFLYDSSENQTIDLTDFNTANVIARKARAVLAFNGFLNPVRGRKNNKYYLPNLKYTQPRSSLIEKTTEIVKQTGIGTLSGVSSIADAQSYALGLDSATTLHIGEGSISFTQDGQGTLVFPPVRLSDSNCPYGQSGSPQIGIRYVHEGGNQMNGIAAQYTGVPACSFVEVRPSYSSVGLPFQLLQVAISASVTGSSNGYPRLTQTTGDGLLYQTQTGVDETVHLDKAFCYLNEFGGFVKFDSSDFTPFDAVPGTRPRMRFKSSKLSV